MDLKELKIYLRDNPEKILDILEFMGCHHIKMIRDKRIQCALPYPSDNPTSISIKLNERLDSVIYTKNEFEQYEYKDFLSVIQFIKQCELVLALEIINEVTGLIVQRNLNKKCVSLTTSILKQFKRHNKNNDDYIEDIILKEKMNSLFCKGISLIYLKDGIAEETQIKFGLLYDSIGNRIVIPIRNEKGELIGFKGRTCDIDYKKKGISKFLSYYPCNNNNYLFGYFENKKCIEISSELLVFEAEKSIMQLDSMNINNVVSCNKKNISYLQLHKLLKSNKTIVLAFDKDVTLEQIYIECRKFKGLCKVMYIYDRDNLLKGKESPCDKGKDVFMKLYDEYKFEYKGE